MKKTLTAVLAATALALTACGGGTDTTTEADQTTQEQEQAQVTDQQAEAWVRDQYGLSPDAPWMDAGGNASYITGVRMDGSNMYVQMQINRSAEKDKAESVTGLLKNAFEMNPPEFADGVSWIIVEDGTGTVVKQESV